jgi:hypothetical protein
MFGEAYPPHAWSYPPHAILLFLPLGLVPYKVAFILFQIVTALLLAVAIRAFVRNHDLAVSPAMLAAGLVAFLLVNLASTQNGFLTAALLVGAFAVVRKNALLAAVLLALLTFKPQLGLLVPLVLAINRQWSVILVTAIFSLGLVVLSGLLLGFVHWQAFFDVTVPFQRAVMTEWSGGMLLMMPTLLSSLRIAGIDAQIASHWQTAFSLTVLPLAVLALWRARGEAPRLLALCLGTITVLPYAFNYDMGALSSAAAIALASDRQTRGAGTPMLTVLVLSPLLVILAAISGLALMPLVLVAALASLALGRSGSQSGEPMA